LEQIEERWEKTIRYSYIFIERLTNPKVFEFKPGRRTPNGPGLQKLPGPPFNPLWMVQGKGKSRFAPSTANYWRNALDYNILNDRLPTPIVKT